MRRKVTAIGVCLCMLWTRTNGFCDWNTLICSPRSVWSFQYKVFVSREGKNFWARVLNDDSALGYPSRNIQNGSSTQLPMRNKSRSKFSHSNGCPRTLHSFHRRMAHRLMKYGWHVWNKGVWCTSSLDMFASKHCFVQCTGHPSHSLLYRSNLAWS